MYSLGYGKNDLLEGDVNVITALGRTSSKVLRINTIKTIGNFKRNYCVVVQKLPDSLFIDGIIGLDFFKNKELTINFKEGFITLL